MDRLNDALEELRHIASKHSITFVTATQILNPNPPYLTGREFLQPGQIEVVIVDYLSVIR